MVIMSGIIDVYVVEYAHDHASAHLPPRPQPHRRSRRTADRAQRHPSRREPGPEPTRTQRLPGQTAPTLQRPAPRAPRQLERTHPARTAPRRPRPGSPRLASPPPRQPGRPGVTFRVELHTPSIVEASAQLRASDGILIPHGHLDDLRHTDLWTDGWVVLADAAHPTIHGSVTLDDLRDNLWVFTYQSRSAFTSANKQLEAMGVEPRVDTVVASFLALPHFIRGTTRLGMIQAGIVGEAGRLDGLQTLRPPFDAAPVANALWWHPIHANDPEHEWMRSIFAQAGQELGTAVGA